MKFIRLLAAIALFVPSLALAVPAANTDQALHKSKNLADVLDKCASMKALGTSPRYFTPTCFNANADLYSFPARAHVQVPFVAEAGSNILQQAGYWTLSNVTINGTATGSNKVFTATFSGSPPPINPAFRDSIVRWRIRQSNVFTTGCTCAFLTNVSIAGSVVTFTTDTNLVTTYSGSGTITIWPDQGAQAPGNPTRIYYDTITTLNTTLSVFNGISQRVLTAAQANGDLNANGTMNVTKVTISSGSFNVQAGGYQDVNSSVQISGAGTGGALFAPTAVAASNGAVVVLETTDAKSIYVYPRVQTQLSSSPQYLLMSPILFAAADAGAGAMPGKYIEVPGIGSCPSPWIGTCPWLAQITSVTDPFQVTLSSTASISNPINSSTFSVFGEMKFGFDDTQALYQAAQTAAQQNVPGIAFMGVPNSYFAATMANMDARLSSLYRVLRQGEGEILVPTSLNVTFAVYPVGMKQRTPESTVSSFDAGKVMYLCNQVIAGGKQCVIDTVANSQGTPFSNGPSQIDNQGVKTCMRIQEQLGGPNNVLCQDLGVGGSHSYDLDPNGVSGGVPGQAANYSWYVEAGTSKKWVDILRDGVDGTASYGINVVACPHVVIDGPFSNTDGFSFSYGAFENVFNTMEGATWKAACGYNPGILLATDGYQPVGDPQLDLSKLWPSNNYSSLIIAALAGGGYLKPAYEQSIGMAANVSRHMRMASDGDDPLSRPLYRYNGMPGGRSGPPWVWPGNPVEDFSLAEVFRFNTSSGLVTPTSFATRCANQVVAWGLFQFPELDLTIGNPNGGGGGGVGQWSHAPEHNEVRFLFNSTANQYGDGAPQCGMSYEINLYDDQSLSVWTGSSGASTITASAASVNWAYQNAVVTDLTGGTIPAGTCIQQMNSAGTSITLKTCASDPRNPTAATLTGNMAAGSKLLFKKNLVPVTSSGEYWLAPDANTSTGAQFLQDFITVEVRGTQVVANISGSGTNIFKLPYVPRFGGAFQPVWSSPGTIGNVGIQDNSPGAIGPTYTRASRPEIPQFAPTATLEGLYGGTPPNGTSGTVVVLSPCDGQQANHRGGCGSKIEDIAIAPLNGRSGNVLPITLNVTANGGVASVPANHQLRAIYIQEMAGNAVTGGINIGTSAGASDVVAAQAVGANGKIVINASGLSKQWFSATAAQQLYVSAVTSWNSAKVHVTLAFD